MPGVIARLVMRAMLKRKSNAEHYISPDYIAQREEQKRLSLRQSLPKSVRRTEDKLGFWFESGNKGRRKLVLYVHGGGFSTGSSEYSYNFPVAVCRNGGYPVFSVEYRLAPEHPFPAGLKDCVAAYQALLDQGYHGTDIVFMGDSAGGNLIFAMALYLRDNGMELPAGLCAVSSVGALDDTPPSRKERSARDVMIGRDFTEEMAAIYLNGHSPKEPYLSPDLRRFYGFSTYLDVRRHRGGLLR